MPMNDRKTNGLLRHAAAALFAVGLFLLVDHMVFSFRTGESDYDSHIVWALSMTPQAALESLFNGSERLWHIFVHLLFPLVGNVWRAASLVTAAADALAYVLVYLIWDRLLPKDRPRRWALAAVLGCVFLVSTLTIPGHSYYGSRGAVNLWHNPTTIMVRPFAAAVFYMTVDIYDRRRYGVTAPGDRTGDFAFDGGFWARFRQPVYTKAEVVLYPLCLLLSVDAKPSFIQVFAPAILLFLLIDVFRTRGKLLPFCLKLALSFLPAGLVTLRMFSYHFGAGFVTVTASAGAAAGGGLARMAPVVRAGGSGVAVYFLRSSFDSFGELLRTLGNRLLSALYPSAFPLFVLLAALKRGWRDTATRLSWLCALAGLLAVWFLHETGGRAGHGNFYWGFFLSVWMLWTVAAPRFLVLWREKSLSGTLIRWGGTALLLWHLVCGIGYIRIILRTLSPYH